MVFWIFPVFETPIWIDSDYRRVTFFADIYFLQDLFSYWLQVVRDRVLISYFFPSSSVLYVFFKPGPSFKTFQQRRDLTINQKTDWLRTDSAAAFVFVRADMYSDRSGTLTCIRQWTEIKGLLLLQLNVLSCVIRLTYNTCLLLSTFRKHMGRHSHNILPWRWNQ
jgi:hypothetical protein